MQKTLPFPAVLISYIYCRHFRRCHCLLAVLHWRNAGLFQKDPVKGALVLKTAVLGDLPHSLGSGDQKILRHADPVGVDQAAEVAAK